MDIGFYLPAHWHDTSRHAVHMYREMLVEARAAEELGFSSLHIPEHHFINYLTHPHPLITAARVAAETKHLPIVTAVLVLPFYDVRRLAGEIALADCLTEGRLEVGVGRGAFNYEFGRFGVPAEESRERFDEALLVLRKLLTEEEVSFKGRWYDFPPLTITPRPLQQPHPPIWIAALTPPAIYHSALAGYDVMTMPLRTEVDGPLKQARAFAEARRELGPGRRRRLSMLQFVYVAKDRADAEEKLRICHVAQRRFHNVFSTPGDVRGGDIQPIDIELTLEALAERTVIGTIDECHEKLSVYADLGLDEMVVNMSFGTPHRDVLGSMERLSQHILPHLKRPTDQGAKVDA